MLRYLPLNTMIGGTSITPDSKFIAISNMTEGFDIWDLDAGKHLASYSHRCDHTLRVPVKFVQKGQTLLGGSTVGRSCVWDVETEILTQDLRHDKGIVLAIDIYGFMRKVILRKVDPAIDDPDASTSHPTLSRNSSPDAVANFKRPFPSPSPTLSATSRLPQWGELAAARFQAPSSLSAREVLPAGDPRTLVPLCPPLLFHRTHQRPTTTECTTRTTPTIFTPSLPPSNLPRPSPVRWGARGFSAPGSFTPINQGGSAWGSSYPRSTLPSLTVPSDPPASHHHGMYNQNHSHNLHPISPAVESPSTQLSAMGSGSGYSHSTHSHNDTIVQSSQYPYYDQSWSFPPNGSSSHSGSLSSLLNPPNSSGYSRPTPTINTSYASNHSGMPIHNDHSPPSLSPDSRPTTGYSMSSVSSLPYEEAHHHGYHSMAHDDYSRPGSSHHRPNSPGLSRPPSSTNKYAPLSIRRPRRHSQVMSPYPSPYDHSDRPSTSPHPLDDGSMPRVRSMIQLPSADYNFGGGVSQPEFAYSAGVGSAASIDSLDARGGWGQHHSVRLSTSTSSISAASHTSSSQANTLPLDDGYGHGGTGINRFSPNFGFVPMNEHMPPQYTKAAGEL
ncbi:hypothetical protein CONPUDRAFT_148165 [Coniophora puteana RWD-64-598 SS2]|uniref:WD40 repeat-like protein n=1 Tax=Coniophora puteana (strain RWD-64-598) TaxID=741705 RepID=A0A5M3N4R5_CONPW|nr:uncharacterized protein CONPUDRAFT_148165 [Coniophora puteana RWD-64-598 SS2]EIW86044.1 hypothetical protein CONPUDRAFT_148165 [Coniophora puteana RWD-64-598 SS2]